LNISQLEADLKASFADFKVSVTESGKLLNASIYTDDEWYQFDVTENEVGLTLRELAESDFGGSDEVFQSLADAIAYLKQNRRTNRR